MLERHEGICREASSRNSEVVHAGIYYPTGSLKALTCVRGRRMLVKRCRDLGIPLLACGKVIVASAADQLPALEELLAQGRANDVEGLEVIDAERLRQLEPGTRGVGALWSPASAVVDSHQLAASLEAEAAHHGADLVFGAEVVGVEPADGGYGLTVTQGEETTTVSAARVVNAAGLGADTLSTMVGIDIDGAGYRQYACKGTWWSIAPRHNHRLSRLVYPVGRAEDPGLGIHGCFDAAGGMRLGPDFVFVEAGDDGVDLSVPEAARAKFLAAGQRLFPWLEAEDLSPDMAGLRAKLVPAPKQWRDFVVAEESARGLPGWVTLVGIESPGLTAAMALAEVVGQRLSSS